MRGRMRWFAGDFDHRANSDDCAELFGNLTLPDRVSPMVRMELEENSTFVELDDYGRIKRRIVKRMCENIPHPIEQLEEPDDPVDPEDEDALDPRDLEYAPKAKWDLTFWTEPRRSKKGKRIMVEASSRWFPAWQDKRLHGQAKIMEDLILQGRLTPQGLYNAIKGLLAQNKARAKRDLSPLIHGSQMKRLWEVMRLRQFTQKAAEGVEKFFKQKK